MWDNIESISHQKLSAGKPNKRTKLKCHCNCSTMSCSLAVKHQAYTLVALDWCKIRVQIPYSQPSFVAQVYEQLAFNHQVVGYSPTGRTMLRSIVALYQALNLRDDGSNPSEATNSIGGMYTLMS